MEQSICDKEGHHFEARHASRITNNTSTNDQPIVLSVYIYDLCIKCGDKIPRTDNKLHGSD